MDNIVELNIDKNFVCLAGNDYGKKVYNEQIKNIIDVSKDFYIKFPSSVKFISSSFVVGLFSEIDLKIIEERAHIISEYESIRSIINKIIWKELFCFVYYWET